MLEEIGGLGMEILSFEIRAKRGFLDNFIIFLISLFSR
jgi:hypothetical protein